MIDGVGEEKNVAIEMMFGVYIYWDVELSRDAILSVIYPYYTIFVQVFYLNQPPILICQTKFIL